MSAATTTAEPVPPARVHQSQADDLVNVSPTPTIVCPLDSLVDVEKPAEDKDEPIQYSTLRKNLILSVLCAAQFFDIYNASATVIAMPSLGADLKLTPSSLQWVTSAYTLTFAAFMLISGRVADILHPKPVFVIGFLILGLLAIPIGASVNPIMIIILRAIQGIGAAMNVPTGVALVRMIFHDPKEQSRAFALYAIAGAVGSSVGLILSSVLAAFTSWRWVFYLLAIITTPIAIGSWFILPSPVPRDNTERKSFDFPGVASITAALILFVFAISSGSGGNWASAQVIAPLVISIFLFVAFFVIEIYVKDPAVPPKTWSNKNFTALFLYGWSIYRWTFGTLLLFVEVFMNLWHWSALSSAVHCLPFGISTGISSYLTGRYGHRIPRKFLLAIGQVLMGIGSILFALSDGPSKYWPYIFPGLIVSMFELGVAYTGITIAVMESARSGEEGVVGAVMYTSYQIGATIGLAIVASIALAINTGVPLDDPVALYKGYAASFWSLLAVNGMACLNALLFVKN